MQHMFGYNVSVIFSYKIKRKKKLGGAKKIWHLLTLKSDPTFAFTVSLVRKTCRSTPLIREILFHLRCILPGREDDEATVHSVVFQALRCYWWGHCWLLPPVRSVPTLKISQSRTSPFSLCLFITSTNRCYLFLNKYVACLLASFLLNKY